MGFRYPVLVSILLLAAITTAARAERLGRAALILDPTCFQKRR